MTIIRLILTYIFTQSVEKELTKVYRHYQCQGRSCHPIHRYQCPSGQGWARSDSCRTHRPSCLGLALCRIGPGWVRVDSYPVELEIERQTIIVG